MDNCADLMGCQHILHRCCNCAFEPSALATYFAGSSYMNVVSARGWTCVQGCLAALRPLAVRQAGLQVVLLCGTCYDVQAMNMHIDDVHAEHLKSILA